MVLVINPLLSRLGRYKEGIRRDLETNFSNGRTEGLIIKLRLSIELPVVTVTLRHLKLGFI